jgi:hypothetical protein
MGMYFTQVVAPAAVGWIGSPEPLRTPRPPADGLANGLAKSTAPTPNDFSHIPTFTNSNAA